MTANRDQRTGPLHRRAFLQLAAGGLAGLGSGVGPASAAPGRRKPNIVLIVADDLGYGDLGIHGCKDIPTPHIDSLARSGVRFDNGYVSCPLCSPTRAGLMTGRYQQRFGYEFNTGRPRRTLRDSIGLPLTEVTLADTLKAAGYATGLVGKWHLGGGPQFHPQKRGFDEFFGFLHGGHPYLGPGRGGINQIMRGTRAVEEKQYLTDAFSREAVAFARKHRKRPFFLYLSYNAVHAPLEATPAYLARFAKIRDPRRRTYAAMLAAMDDGVGRLLRALRAWGLERDTLVLFLSDNGGATLATTAQNGKLRSHKGALYEGGVRVPFLAQWKGRLPAGTSYSHPVSSLDIFPTAVAAAGGALPKKKLDGVDLLPHLTGKAKGQPHETLYWRVGQRRAIRRGRYKLVQRRDAPAELFDLARDPGESKDLAAAKPKLRQGLAAALKGWESTLAAPLWRPQRPGRRRRRGPRGY